MPRLPYLNDAAAAAVAPAELLERIRARRGGELLNLDRMLLYSPALAAGWNGFLGAVRNDLVVDARLRELAMCAVAVLNGADYEYRHHAPLYIAAGGSRERAEALRALGAGDGQDFDQAGFDETERAVLRLTLEMTRRIQVDERSFAAARSALGGERELVEIIGVIAAYNMVSRFLVALGVEPEN